MSTTLHAVVSEVCSENGRPPREMDEEIVRRARQANLIEPLALDGAAYQRRTWEHNQRAQAVRSGHNNGSGRMQEAAKLSRLGITAMPIQVGGERYTYGELTAELSQRLVAERTEQLEEDQRWLDFFTKVEAERKRRKAKTIAAIGDEALEQIREVVFGE